MSQEEVKPVGFIGKDILAVPDREYRKELAAEFRAAVEAAKERVLPKVRSCDWCGRDLYTRDDHFRVDGRLMCNPCDNRYTVRLPDQDMER